MMMIASILYKHICSTQSLKAEVDEVRDEYFLLQTRDVEVEWQPYSLERMLSIASSTGSKMIYSNYFDVDSGGVKIQHPVCEYQIGSVRDDFDFGAVVLLNTAESVRILNEMPDYDFSAFYALRLAFSRLSSNAIFKVDEYLYSVRKTDYRNSGERQFDYVLRDRHLAQVEYEKVFSEHLDRISALCTKTPLIVKNEDGDFSVEASVVIPVKNRELTIDDAIKSAMVQNTDFSFNIIVVDNHSTDRTSEIIQKYVECSSKVLHIVPQSGDLNIGGCWNEAVHHPECGRYVVQLDSDDLYSGPDTLQLIIDKFRSEKSAMVIGSYRMVDFDLNEIPPGIIAHKEWTDLNGRNNALRINGFGAPRAFSTSVLRTINFPNVSYGEDYAVALAISRQWKISRIFEPIYLCRRWRDNSDAKLSIEKENANNYYKDKIRSIEISSRINIMQNEK